MEENVKMENQNDFMSEEEFRNLSKEEKLKWLEELTKAFSEMRKTLEADGEGSVFDLNPETIEKAYRDPEVQEYFNALNKLDVRERLFNDEEEVKKINEAWKVVLALPENPSPEESEDAYHTLYEALYPYIRRVNPFWGVGAERLSLWEELQKSCRTVYALDASAKEAFRGLMPERIYNRIGDKNVFALGAVCRKEGKQKAAGVLVFYLDEAVHVADEAVGMLKWLCVSEEFRRQHIGDSLMAAFYNTLNKAGVEAVSARIPMDEISPFFVGDFLSRWWIRFAAEPQRELYVPLETLYIALKGNGKIPNHPKVEAAKPDGKSIEELTLCLTEDEKILGGIAVEEEGKGCLLVRNLWAENGNPSYMDLLLRAMLLRAVKHSGKNTVLLISPETEEEGRLWDSVLKNHGCPYYMVGANLTEELDIDTETFERLRQYSKTEGNAE